MSADLVAGPAWRPLWSAARRRLEANSASLAGAPLVLKGLTAQEADAISGLLGVGRPPDGTMRVALGRLDRALRASAVGCGLVELLTELGGPLVDRQAARGRADADRARRWEGLASHPAVAGEPELAGWLAHVRGTGLARRLAGADEGAAVARALDVLHALAGGPGRHRLAVLAAQVTGDAHGLDRGRATGTLSVHALAWLGGEPFPRDAADWRRVWSDAGVACDDLSCDVLVHNLPGVAAEPRRLTLRQAVAWKPPRPTPTVWVTENPAVVAAAADHLGGACPTMVCLEGMPSTAALVVIEALVAAGAAVRYHGDFDWRGLAIAAVLSRKVPTSRPWRFDTIAYRGAVDAGLGSVALAGRPTSSPWDPALAGVMADTGVAVYEEQVVDLLLADLTEWAEWAERAEHPPTPPALS